MVSHLLGSSSVSNIGIEDPGSTLFLVCGHCLCSAGNILVQLPTGLVFGAAVFCFHFLTSQAPYGMSLRALSFSVPAAQTCGAGWWGCLHLWYL